MVRATVFVSALFALVASVSAVPTPHFNSLVEVVAGDHIGTGNINANNLGKDAVNAENLEVQNVIKYVNILGENYDSKNVGGSSDVSGSSDIGGSTMNNGGCLAPGHSFQEGCHHHDGNSQGVNLDKRDEETSAAVRITKKIGMKGMKKNTNKAGKAAKKA